MRNPTEILEKFGYAGYYTGGGSCVFPGYGFLILSSSNDSTEMTLH